VPIPILRPTVPRIIPICLPLSDFSTGKSGELLVELVGDLFTLVVSIVDFSGSNCIIHVKFLMSRI
jgi:hypothetical protein